MLEAGKGSRGARGIVLYTLAVLAFCSVILPQFGYFGRGVKGTAAAFFLWALLTNWEELFVVVRKERLWIIGGAILAMSMAVRLRIGVDDPRIVITDLVCLFKILAIVTIVGYHGRTSPAAYGVMKLVVVIVAGIALAPSLVELYENPMIARKLMQQQIDGEGVDFHGALFGVGSYGLYSALGVCFPLMLGIALSSARRVRWVGLAACGVIFVAVALSSFTGATALLTGGCVCLLSIFLFSSSRQKVALRLAFCVAAGAAVAVTLGYFAAKSSASEFVIKKAEGLYETMTEDGVVRGDSTGRGQMFVATFDTFLRHPFFGVGYRDSDGFVGGHSSWIDPWARFGVFGYALFFIAQISLTLRVAKMWAFKKNRLMTSAALVSICLFWCSGILNPALNHILPVLLVFLGWTSAEASVHSRTDGLSDRRRPFLDSRRPRPNWHRKRIS